MGRKETIRLNPRDEDPEVSRGGCVASSRPASGAPASPAQGWDGHSNDTKKGVRELPRVQLHHVKRSQCWMTSESGVCPERPAGLSPRGWTRAVVSPEGHRTREGTAALPQSWFLREAETPSRSQLHLPCVSLHSETRYPQRAAGSWAQPSPGPWCVKRGQGTERRGGCELKPRLLWVQLGQ